MRYKCRDEKIELLFWSRARKLNPPRKAACYFKKKETARNSYDSFDSVIAYSFVFVRDHLSSEEKEGSSLLLEGRKASAP